MIDFIFLIEFPTIQKRQNKYSLVLWTTLYLILAFFEYLWRPSEKMSKNKSIAIKTKTSKLKVN